MMATRMPILQELKTYRQMFSKKKKEIETTIFLYQVYNEKELEDLKHLHYFGRKMVDPNYKIRIKFQRMGRMTIPVYSADETQEGSLRSQMMNLDDGSKEDDFTRIGIYENNQNNELRVVCLPIPEAMILNQQSDDFQKFKNSQEEGSKNYKRTGSDKQQAKRQQNRVIQKQFERQKSEKESFFLFKLRLAALMRVLMDQTNAVIFCKLLEYGGVDLRPLESYQKEFSDLFEFEIEARGDVKPKLIFYSYDSQLPIKAPIIDISNSSVIGLFNCEQEEEVEISREEWTKPKHDKHIYIPKKGTVNTKLFSNIPKSNAVMLAIIKQFIEQCATMGQEVSSSVAFALKDVTEKIQQSQQLSQSQIQSQSLLQPNIAPLSFREINQKYKLNEDNLKSVSDRGLEYFYTPQRKEQLNLMGKFKIESLPSNLKSLLLASEISLLGTKFIENKEYDKKLLKYNRDQTGILADWKIFLKDIFSLLKTLNTEVDSDLIEGCYKLLLFIIDSCINLKKIINIQVGLSSAFKVMFEKILPDRQKIILYIINHNHKSQVNEIQKNQSFNYYSIYLALLKGNIQTDEVKETECELKELRVNALDKDKESMSLKYDVVRIKDLASLILDYRSLPSFKREYQKIQKCETELIKWLPCVGKEEIAVEICFKLRKIGHAHKLIKVAKMRYRGDKRVKKLIRWGQKIQRELEYQLALEYYRQAFDCAKTLENQQLAVSKKLECRKKIREPEATQVLFEFKEFIRVDTDSNEKFTSKMDISKVYQCIRDQLQWNEEKDRAVFVEGEDQEGNPNFLD